MTLKFKNKRILFIGDLNEGTRSLMRSKKLKNICANTIAISNVPVPFVQGVDKYPIIDRIFNKIHLPIDRTKINSYLLKSVQSSDYYDLVWIDKSTMVYPSTLKKIKRAFPAAKIISVSEDDMYALHNRSYYYTKSLPLFDIVFTTKPFNLEELKNLGAKQTELFLDSYDEDLHRPIENFNSIEKKDIDISFIGTYEPERAESIKLIGSRGIKVVVFGSGWDKIKDSKDIEIKNYPIYGNSYVEIINRTKINLGFLRKINRDQVTSRSMEITGAGGFFLAERTERHVRLFLEGNEAEFFSSDDELFEKITTYLNKPKDILKIGISGRQRCISSGYDMKNQILSILERAFI